MLTQEVAEIVSSVWQSLDLEIELIPEPNPLSRSHWELTGCIQITGAWKGALTATCGQTLGRSLAAAMLGMPIDEVSDADVNDALGEIVNMLGGNVKALLPPPCQLSLPSVTNGSQYYLTVSQSKVVNTLHFESSGQPLILQVLEERSSNNS
jgi:chemotaxis protein CheX